MSWQAYIDTSLVGSGCVQKAAILGHDGSTWATSAGFSVKAPEAKALAQAFSNPAAAPAAGLTIDGVKYIVLRADEKSIYAKKGNSGLCCVKTGKAMLVGFYDQPTQPGQASSVVEKLGDYLREVGY
jgi:profilin